MANGGMFISKKDVEKLVAQGDVQRRGSAMITAPSIMSLNDKSMDIFSIGTAPEEGKEEKKDS